MNLRRFVYGLMIGFGGISLIPIVSHAQTPAGTQLQTVDNTAIANGLAQAAQPAQGTEADPTHRAAFESALSGAFPFKPDEIHSIMERLDQNQAAMATPVGVVPKAEVKAETISLDPGIQPPEIDTETGFVTTVSFLDATGNPWPILDIGVGGNFEVPAPEEGGNVLRLTPLAKYAVGNLSVRLVHLTTPISFKLRAGTDKVYYRYDARIGKFGPNAAAPLIDHGGGIVAGDAMLMNVLDGAAPLDSTRLNVLGVDTRTAAWRINDKIYVRTPFQLLSPGWEGSVSSGDGTHVYELADTPVLLLSDNGVLVHARIGNRAQPDEQPVPAIDDSRAHPVQKVSATQSAGQLITMPDTVLPTPTSSRTLIRPVPVPAQQAQNASTNGASTTSAATQSPSKTDDAFGPVEGLKNTMPPSSSSTGQSGQ